MKRIFRKKIRGVSGEGGEGRKVWLFPTYYFFQCFLTYVYTFSFLLPTVFSNLSLLARLAAGCCSSFLCFLIPKPYPHFFLMMETYIYIYICRWHDLLFMLGCDFEASKIPIQFFYWNYRLFSSLNIFIIALEKKDMCLIFTYQS